uniref:Uncharacterized protein n=1 Tax=Amphimedon queenslandica TaxID=400682 RepID=A0A1X7VC10_AMPQE
MFHRHPAANDVICRALSAAGISSVLELSGLSSSDGRRPDGLSLVPWHKGKPLVWDATITDSLALSYCSVAVSEAGALTGHAETKKASKYSTFKSSHHFVPVVVESLGTWALSLKLTSMT